MKKYASFKVLSAALAVPGAPLLRTAHRATFDYTPRPGFLYVRSRAISSRANDNFDEFPAIEIEAAWRSFVGKPVFVNHHNDNHRRARGVIIDAALHTDTNPDGTPDTWVEVLMEVDAVRFPKLAQAILAGEIERTSMGVDVAESICSFCGNRAATPLSYCVHIPRLKGKRIRRVTASGQREDVLVTEICTGLHFFENSLLVEDPADPTAYFLGVDARGVGGELVTTASRHTAADWTHSTEEEVIAHWEELRKERLERERKTASIFTTPGYYVMGQVGPIAGPYATPSAATQAQVEVSGSGVQFLTSSDASGKASTEEFTHPDGHAGEFFPSSLDPAMSARRGPIRTIADLQSRVKAFLMYPHKYTWADKLGLAMDAQKHSDPEVRKIGDALMAELWPTAKSANLFTAEIDPEGLPDATKFDPNAENLWRVTIDGDPFMETPYAADVKRLQDIASARGNVKVEVEYIGPERRSEPREASFGLFDDLEVEAAIRFNWCAYCDCDLAYENVFPDQPRGWRDVNSETHDPHCPLSPDGRHHMAPGSMGTDVVDPVMDLGYDAAKHTAHADIWDRCPRCGHNRLLVWQDAHDREIGECLDCGYEQKAVMAEAASKIPESDQHLHDEVRRRLDEILADVAKKKEGTAHVGYGETLAPAAVDTLRDDACPVCGEAEAYSGDECAVCGYIKPPDMFCDPDVDKAKALDLRQDQIEPGAETPTEGIEPGADSAPSKLNGVERPSEAGQPEALPSAETPGATPPPGSVDPQQADPTAAPKPEDGDPENPDDPNVPDKAKAPDTADTSKKDDSDDDSKDDDEDDPKKKKNPFAKGGNLFVHIVADYEKPRCGYTFPEPDGSRCKGVEGHEGEHWS